MDVVTTGSFGGGGGFRKLAFGSSGFEMATVASTGEEVHQVAGNTLTQL